MRCYQDKRSKKTKHHEPQGSSKDFKLIRTHVVLSVCACIPTTAAVAAAFSATTTDPAVQTVADLLDALNQDANAGSSTSSGGAGRDGNMQRAFACIHAQLAKFVHAATAPK